MKNLTTHPSKFVASLCLFMIVVGHPSLALAQSDKDQEIARLQRRTGSGGGQAAIHNAQRRCLANGCETRGPRCRSPLQ